jgi:hypothetical protein
MIATAAAAAAAAGETTQSDLVQWAVSGVQTQCSPGNAAYNMLKYLLMLLEQGLRVCCVVSSAQIRPAIQVSSCMQCKSNTAGLVAPPQLPPTMSELLQLHIALLTSVPLTHAFVHFSYVCRASQQQTLMHCLSWPLG